MGPAQAGDDIGAAQRTRDDRQQLVLLGTFMREEYGFELSDEILESREVFSAWRESISHNSHSLTNAADDVVFGAEPLGYRLVRRRESDGVSRTRQEGPERQSDCQEVNTLLKERPCCGRQQAQSCGRHCR